MEIRKTRCLDCGHTNRWQAYKYACDESRRAHNRKNASECPKCGSTNVTERDDEETMEPYMLAASLLVQARPGPDLHVHAGKTDGPKSQVETTPKHQWTDGPDGPLYHCSVCGISKVDDWGGIEDCPGPPQEPPAPPDLSTATIAPYGPDVSLTTNGDGSGHVTFMGGTYTFQSKQDLLDRADKLPFTVEVIQPYPGHVQVKVGDDVKDAHFWRCPCGCLNRFAAYCFACGAPKEEP